LSWFHNKFKRVEMIDYQALQFQLYVRVKKFNEAKSVEVHSGKSQGTLLSRNHGGPAATKLHTPPLQSWQKLFNQIFNLFWCDLMNVDCD